MFAKVAFARPQACQALLELVQGGLQGCLYVTLGEDLCLMTELMSESAG